MQGEYSEGENGQRGESDVEDIAQLKVLEDARLFNIGVFVDEFCVLDACDGKR